MFRTLSVGLLLGEEVTSSFFTSFSSFWVTTSKVVLSLDLRLVCLVVGSLIRGFFRVGLGLAWFLGWRITLFSTLSSTLSSCFPITYRHWLV